MSGQGANFTIANCTGQNLQVAVTNVEGMNIVPPGGPLPAGGYQGPSYIEATLIGTSTFNIVVGPFNIPFNVSGWAYYVAGSTVYTVNDGALNVTVVVAQRGEGTQDGINVILY